MERHLLLLRWLALLLVLLLHLFDRSRAGVLFPVPSMALVVTGFNGLHLILVRHVRWLQRPLNYLALDTGMATLAVYLTGGYHSSFFVLYVFVAIGVAFCLELMPTIAVTVGIGLIYVGVCYVSPAGLLLPSAPDITTARILLLLVVGVECALLIEQLRREQQTTERERERVAHLRALEELQKGFVSAVSHELRTPLTCIKTSVDLLHSTSNGLSETQTDLIRTIGHHLERLEALVTDLIEITRLEAGGVTLSRQPTDLRVLVHRVTEALSPLTDRKHQVVRLHWPDPVPEVEVDRRRIEQVLTNILSNAAKFAPKGGQIDVSVAERATGVQVCVTDKGPGIPVEEQTRIFEKFYVVHDGRGLSGLGLGLYIARQYVELHGGRIWVESLAGRGSTFCFSIPKAGRGEWT